MISLLQKYFSVDYGTLQEELQVVSIKVMIELCSNWKDETASADLQFTCCPTVKPCIKSILNSFYLAIKSEIFRGMWKNKLSTSLKSHHGAFTQNDVVELVWKPTVNDCWTLIHRLKTGEMLMSEVKKIFRGQDIHQSCLSLLNSLPLCFPVDVSESNRALTTAVDYQSKSCFLVDVSSDQTSSVNAFTHREWIDTVCKQFDHYIDSLECIECAQAILTIRDKLNLKGDFSRIQVLDDKVTVQY